MSLSYYCHWYSIHALVSRLQIGTTCTGVSIFIIFPFSFLINVSRRIVYLSFLNVNERSTMLR